jgi:hypothetical protein
MKFFYFCLSLFFYSLAFGQTAYDTLNTDASFPGGEKALEKFIKANLIYPEECSEKEEFQTVYVRFYVEKDGKISNIHVDTNEKFCSEFAIEAQRIVTMMPNWIPGKINGNKEKIACTLPVKFSNATKNKVDLNSKFFEPNWAGIDLGIGQLMNSEFQAYFPSHSFWENNSQKSWHFNYNFFEYKIPILKQYLGMVSGLGYSIRGISFNSNYNLVHNADTIYAVVESEDLRRNKLTNHYLTVPLLLEFATKKNTRDNFYLSFGFVGSWRFSSYTFQRGTHPNGDNFSHFTYSNFNQRKLNLESAIRIGYSYFGIHASYQLNSMFKKDKTIPVYPFRIGLTINMDFYQE